MKLLLKHGADPNIPTFCGHDGLMAAAGVNWVFDQTFDEGQPALLEAVKLCVELGHRRQRGELDGADGAARRGQSRLGRDHPLPRSAGREARREGCRRTHAADMGRRRVPRHASRQAKAKLDRVAQTVGIDLIVCRAARETMNASETNPRSESFPLAIVRCGSAALAFVWGDTAAVERATTAGSRPRRRPASPDPTFLTQYCIGCHNQRAKVAGLALDTLDLSKVGPDAETWEKVVKKIRTGMMPPSGARRPERTALDGFATNLEQRLDKAADPNAALVTPALHRLNRTEYANAIRDLLALDVDVNVAAAGRWFEPGIRQSCRSARRVAVADSGLRLSGDEDQPAGGRRQDDGPVADDVLAATGAGAGPPHRRPAARDARRLPDSRTPSRSMPSTSSRSAARRRRSGRRRRHHARRRTDQGREPAQLPHEGVGRSAHDRPVAARSSARCRASTRSTRTSAWTPTFTTPAACPTSWSPDR